MKKFIKSSILAITLSVFLISIPSAYATDYIDAGNGMVFFSDNTQEVKHGTQISLQALKEESKSMDHIDAGKGMVFFSDNTHEVKTHMGNSMTKKTTDIHNEILAIDDVAAGHETVFY